MKRHCCSLFLLLLLSYKYMHSHNQGRATLTRTRDLWGELVRDLEMKGVVSHDSEVAVSAAKVWDFCASCQLMQLLPKLVPNTIEKTEIEGDGGVGTTTKLFFAPGIPGVKYVKDEVVKVDHEKRVVETKQIEGGHLDLGFLSSHAQVEIVEKDANTCIIKGTIEYEIGEGSSADPSLITTHSFATLSEAIAKHLCA